MNEFKDKIKNEDYIRQKYILNIIILSSLFVFIIFDIVILRNSIIKKELYDGVKFIPFILITLFYTSLYFGVKKGFIKSVSYLTIYSYMAGALYCGFHWGVSLPATLLTFTLIIQISTILLGTRIGLIMTVISMFSIVILGIHEYKTPDILNWRFEPVNITDFVTYSSILGFISCISWLSNKEIEKSLIRARNSENELKIERDLLEIKVEERTKELRNIQLQRINELAKVAEFGRISQGLMHDLMSPMSSIFLNMEKFKELNINEIRQSFLVFDKIVNSSKKINNYISNIRNSMKIEMPKRKCLISEEIQNTISLLQYKANSNNTKINIIKNDECIWYGDSIKLNQIFSNIISNAIDACSNKKDNVRKINITIKKHRNDTAYIKISDTGCGISEENIEKIFDPFYTTKSIENGTGIGLTTVKKIINELRGKIIVKSEENIGSEFIITIPL